MQISFMAALAILFIALKLAGVIAWTWFWVLAPIWGPLVLFLGIALGGLLMVGIATRAPKS